MFTIITVADRNSLCEVYFTSMDIQTRKRKCRRKRQLQSPPS